MWFQHARRVAEQTALKVSETLDRRRWLGGTVVLAAAVTLLPWGIFPNEGRLTSYSAVWVFAGLATTSIALFALRYAIATFRGQHYRKLPPVLAREFFETQEHIASSWRLVTIFLTSLWTLAPIDQSKLPPNALTVAFTDTFLLLVTILSVVRDSRQVFDPNYSNAVANWIVRRLDDSYLAQQHARGAAFPPPPLVAGVITEAPDTFALVEQVSVLALTEHDLTTANVVLRRVTGRVLAYLDGREFVARGVLAWLGALLATVGRRALIFDERTVSVAVLLFEDVITWTLQRPEERRLHWHDRRELLISFRELRHAAIEERKSVSAAAGLYTLSRTFATALQTAPVDEQIWLLHSRDPSPPAPNAEIDNEWMHLNEDWIFELGRDMDLLSSRDLEDAFGTGLFTYNFMMDDVLNSDHLGIAQKRSLAYQIVIGAGSAIRQALRKGAGEAYVSWPFEPHIFDELESAGLNDLVDPLLSEWQRVMVAAVRADRLPWMGLNLFAAAGRGLARHEQDAPVIAIARTLRRIAEILREHGISDRSAGYDDAIKALRSLANFDQREMSALKTAIQEDLTTLGESLAADAEP